MNRVPLARTQLRWAIALPLVLAGTLAAHAAAYAIAFPSPTARARDLAVTGHGYLDRAPLALAILFGFLLVGLVANVGAIVRRAPRREAPAWLLASLPPLVFAIQEHLERYVHTGHVPASAALERSFVVGLALQLPFALLALLLARLLTNATETLGRRLSAPLWPTAGTPFAIAPSSVLAARLPVLSSGFGVRGPPSV